MSAGSSPVVRPPRLAGLRAVVALAARVGGERLP
jgi:hypothetical protein